MTNGGSTALNFEKFTFWEGVLSAVAGKCAEASMLLNLKFVNEPA